MKALRVHGFDGPGSWRLEDVPTPRPGPGEVLVRVAATAISYVDLLFARGGYQLRPDPPFVPGTELSGTIAACGPGDTGSLAVGQPVTGTVFGGAWAQYACVPVTAVAALAPTVPLDAASALPITGATALYALRERGGLRRGETVLVLGAAGGVGLAAIQVAKALGARVVAGAGGGDKGRAARAAGADDVVDTRQDDWRAAVRAVAPDGIDVVVDPVGGALTDTAFRTLRWGGRHLVVGFTEGQIPSLRANLALLKGAALVGVDVRQWRERDPAAAHALLGEVASLMAQGRLRPPVAASFDVRDWSRAVALAADRATVGRVVIRWDEEHRADEGHRGDEEHRAAEGHRTDDDARSATPGG